MPGTSLVEVDEPQGFAEAWTKDGPRLMPTVWKASREVAGPLLTLATAFSLVRVFEGDDWVVPVVIAAGVGHLLAAAVRGLGGGTCWCRRWSAGAGLILAVTWTHYWDVDRVGSACRGGVVGSG